MSVYDVQRSHSSSQLTITATKLNAIVGGQTSCKAPEIAAFEKHLPPDVDIVSCHSLHGPGVNPKGQPLVCFIVFPLMHPHLI
jgi:prephenate dehydrogenase